MALSYERRHAGILGLHKRPSGGFSFMGLVRSIEVNSVIVGNAGAGEDPLHDYSLPINSLRRDEDYIEGEGSGKFAANANTKTVRFYIDGTIQAVIVVANGPQGWVLRYKIVRLSATSVRISCTLEANVLRVNSAGAVTLSTGYSSQANNADEPVPNLNTNALNILVTGEGTANDDVTQNLTIIELVQN